MKKETTLIDIGKASEPVLHEIFGILVSEKELSWDSTCMIDDNTLYQIYGLLCLIEKPLLPDQAGDLNRLLNLLLKHRNSTNDHQYLAKLDTNIALITEYFEQRFK